LPVTVVGIGSGVNYSTLGATHHALEDVALATGLPNMQVIAPCDPAEVGEATRWCTQQTNGPVYLRLARAGEPVLTKEAAEPWTFGKVRYLRRGRGDICLLSYGSVMKVVLALADKLEAQGQSVSVVSVHTLKPLDSGGITAALVGHKQVAVIEEMLPRGGLASKVKELAWDTKATCDLRTFTLKDEFVHCYGNYEQVLAAHGLSVDALLGKLA
jgi:transketolase